MSHDIHHDAHERNVCLTGGVVIAAFCTGLAITALVFWQAFFHH